MPQGWEQEVKDILERAKALERQSPRSRRRVQQAQPIGAMNPIEVLGNLVIRQLATPKDMAVTGALVLAVALMMSLTPLGRVAGPTLVVIGAILLAAAYIRTLLAQRSTGSTGPSVWRGKVVEFPRRRGFLHRLFRRDRSGR